VPTAYFARRALKRRPGQTPVEMAGAFYRGEIGKIVLTALLFALGIGVFAKQFLALIVTYGACLLAYWIVIARIAMTESHGSD
jgi:ATP synthase protein I